MERVQTIAIIATDGMQRSALIGPRSALEAAGMTCVVVSETEGAIETFSHLDRAESIPVDAALPDARADAFDGLLLPDGVADPDTVRGNSAVVDFVRQFVDASKPVAAMGHASRLVIAAGGVAGRSLTSEPALRTELEHAGARWVDRPVVRDGQLVTSRGPDDHEAFAAAAISLFTSSVTPDDDRALDAQLDESFPASDAPSIAGGPATAV